MSVHDRLLTNPLFEAPYRDRVAIVYEIIDLAGGIRLGALWNGQGGARSPVPLRHLREIASKDPAGFDGHEIPQDEEAHTALLQDAGLIVSSHPTSV